MLVHPTQTIVIFGNISTALDTLAIRWDPQKILRRSSQGNRSVASRYYVSQRANINTAVDMIQVYDVEWRHQWSRDLQWSRDWRSEWLSWLMSETITPCITTQRSASLTDVDHATITFTCSLAASATVCLSVSLQSNRSAALYNARHLLSDFCRATLVQHSAHAVAVSVRCVTSWQSIECV